MFSQCPKWNKPNYQHLSFGLPCQIFIFRSDCKIFQMIVSPTRRYPVKVPIYQMLTGPDQWQDCFMFALVLICHCFFYMMVYISVYHFTVKI